MISQRFVSPVRAAGLQLIVAVYRATLAGAQQPTKVPLEEPPLAR